MPDIGPTWQDDVREKQSREERRDRFYMAGEILRLEKVISDEVKLLKKEIDLMKLRVGEERDPVRKEMIRTFGSCLWRHQRALEKCQS